MNQQQRKYAKERVSAIHRRREMALKQEHTTSATKISREQKTKLVRQGKVKLKTGISCISSHDYALSVFDFSKYESPAVVNERALSKALSALTSELNKVTDEIMLGDEKKALELISKFDAA